MATFNPFQATGGVFTGALTGNTFPGLSLQKTNEIKARAKTMSDDPFEQMLIQDDLHKSALSEQNHNNFMQQRQVGRMSLDAQALNTKDPKTKNTSNSVKKMGALADMYRQYGYQHGKNWDSMGDEELISRFNTKNPQVKQYADAFLTGNDESEYRLAQQLGISGNKISAKAKLSNNLWDNLWGNMKTKASGTVDSWKKFGQRALNNLGGNIYKGVLKKVLGDDYEKITGVNIDDYIDTVTDTMVENEVMDYQNKLNQAYAEREAKNVDADVNSYYEQKGYTKLLKEGDFKGFLYKAFGDMGQNWDMPVIVAASVFQPEVGFALMATDTYARENQDTFEAMVNNGASYEEAEKGGVVVGLINAAVEVGLEKALGGMETRAADRIRDIFSKNLRDEAVKKGLGRLFLDGVIDQAKASGEEGLEEIIQQFVQNVAVKTVNENQDLFQGLGQAFEGGFYNPMNLLVGGSNIVSGVKNSGGMSNINTQTNTNTQNNNGIRQGILDRMTDWGAQKITGTVSAQDKLYKAQEPRMNVLSNKKNLENRRVNSDRANQLIIENGYVPTNTTERLNAHQATLNKLWKQVMDQVNQGEGVTVDQTPMIDALSEYINSKKKLGVAGIESDIRALEAELESLQKMQEEGTTDLPTLEAKKQVYNDLIDWKSQEASEVYKGGIKLLTQEIGKIEDNILSEIPGEFSNLKKDVGALLDTYEDVFKADMKNQRSKGMGLTETYSRIEGIGDTLGGIFQLFKGDVSGVAKGLGKLALGKSLAKAKDVDFLIEQGFKELANQQGLNQNQTNSKTAKYQVANDLESEYEDAVKNGNIERAREILREYAEQKGYNSSSDYQGSKAFNGSAPSSEGYTKAERIDPDTEMYSQTLGDYASDGVDLGDLEWQLTDRGNYMRGNAYTKESIDNLNKAVEEYRNGNKNAKITMYRAIDANIKEDGFRNGDWITPSKKYAEHHIDLQDRYNGRIITEEVPIENIWWDNNDINEWGYDDGKEYGYKNTKNNRKELDITYDDNGNLIPLRERFDENKSSPKYQTADSDNQLIGLRNTTLGGLTKTVEVGGMPMPSIAVTKRGVPHTDYGDITLIMKESAINPKLNSANKVHIVDGYTPEIPQPIIRLKETAEAEKIAKRIQKETGISYGDFEQWIENKEQRERYHPEMAKYDKEYSEITEKKLWGGIDDNGRHYLDYNAENLVKQMLENKEDAYNGQFGKMVAQYKGDINDIEELRNREYGPKDEAKYDKLFNDYYNSVHELYEKVKNNDNFGGEGNFQEALAYEYDRDTNKWLQSLRDEYNYKDSVYMKLKKSDLDKLQKIIKEGASVIRPYSEAKPERAVKWDEIGAVVVPEENLSEVKKLLKDVGVDVYGYKEGERMAVVDRVADEKNLRFQRYGMANANEQNMTANEGLNIENFKNGRTVKEIADQYGIDTKIVEKILTPEGQRAYGMYDQGLITLSKDLKESTVPHELLHAVFDMVDAGKRQSILNGIEKKLNVDSVAAEEWLADSFSEYYRTGTFGTQGLAKTFVEKVKQFFYNIKKFIDGTYQSEKQIRQLFDDIIEGNDLVSDNSVLSELDDATEDKYGHKKTPGPYLVYNGKDGFHLERSVWDEAQNLR